MIVFKYPEIDRNRQNWWLVIEASGKVDLCNSDPGFNVDLVVTGTLRAMTAVWMGVTTVKKETEAGELDIHGDPAIARVMQQWLGLSPFAKEKSRLAA